MRAPPSARGGLIRGLFVLGLVAVIALGTHAGTKPQDQTPPARNSPEQGLLLLEACRSAEGLVALGERGTLLLSRDHGRTWTRREAPPGDTLTGLCFAPDGRRGWAVGHGGRILSSEDGGLSWKNNYTHGESDAVFLDIACLGASHLVAIGAFGLALESRDGGATWSALSLPCEDRHLNKITPLPSGGALIAGEAGLLLRCSADADNWTSVPAPYEGSFFGFMPLADGSLLAYGLRGTILHSAPLATPGTSYVQWTQVPAPTKGILATALQLRDGKIVMAGQARTLLLSTDAGRSFQPWQTGLLTAVSELLEANDGSLLAFGEAGVTRLPAP